MRHNYIDPFEDLPKKNREACPVCKEKMNPFGIERIENSGFLGLGIKRTVIYFCTNCSYEHEELKC